MLSIVILSAGLSSRFGGISKALAPWGQGNVINHLLSILINSKIDEIIVVLGAHRDHIRTKILKHKKIKVVYNKDYIFGQTSSFKAGLKSVSAKALSIGLLPVDYPLIKGSTFDQIAMDFWDHGPAILIPTYQGKKGHPPFFHSSIKSELLDLPDDIGLYTLAHRHGNDIRYCEVEDEGVLLSFNTPQELEHLRNKFI